MHQPGALQRLKDSQRAKKQLSSNGQKQHLASASDADNEAYMQEFEQAFSQFSAIAGGSQPQNQQPGQLGGSSTTSISRYAAPKQPPAALDGEQAERVRRSGPAGGGAIASSRPRLTNRAAAAVPAAASSWHSSRDGQTAEPYSVKQRGTGPQTAVALAAGWQTGPVNEAGDLLELCDRPIMCSAASWDANEVVVGSSDHALYVVDIQQNKKKRTLYNKTCGHTEWVTCACYLPGNRILSGGMDGRLWLWPSGGSSGTEVKQAHSAPVSKVASLSPAESAAASASSARSARPAARSAAAAAGPQLAVSCSYDKTVRVWDVSNNVRVKDVAVLSGHSGPVLELDVLQGGQSIITGDRKGNLMCWDLAAGDSSWGVSAAHEGHITALTWQHSATRQQTQQDMGVGSGSTVLSGGQDGHVRVWDGRTGDCAAEQAVHVDRKGKGAVGNIIAGCGSKGDLVVTCGADHTLRVLDPAMSYQPLHTVKLTDFPYSLAAIGNLAICGCGDGSVHVVDVDVGRTLYALGAGKAAIRAIEVSQDRLVCSGDDGYVISYSFM